ncbi:MAG: phosphoglycerate dehydrogenase [Acidobacteria bacterium]|nr:phosphoglycerate dehydrogenase [Acidobacteriota bacterium]MBV9478219.1 phosphoglycerate dehydrogenase [Acidobacteriota bacterium]
MKRLLIAADIDRSLDARAEADGRFVVTRNPVRTEDELARIVGDAQVLVTRAYNKVSRRVLDAAPNLELIAQGTSGIDNIDADAVRERGIRVLHMPGVNADAVAELVLGFMISLTRTVPCYTREVVRGAWPREDCATRHELHHHRLGIVGLGNVGLRVARLARVFGMDVRAFDPYLSDADFVERNAARAATLDELLASSDILTLHVPLSPETRRIVGARELARLPRGAYVINASRGEVLDQRAALDALAANALAGLALDVFDPEPPEGGFPDDPRLILTPHVGGCTFEVKSDVGGRLFKKIAAFYGS